MRPSALSDVPGAVQVWPGLPGSRWLGVCRDAGLRARTWRSSAGGRERADDRCLQRSRYDANSAAHATHDNVGLGARQPRGRCGRLPFPVGAYRIDLATKDAQDQDSGEEARGAAVHAAPVRACQVDIPLGMAVGRCIHHQGRIVCSSFRLLSVLSEAASGAHAVSVCRPDRT